MDRWVKYNGAFHKEMPRCYPEAGTIGKILNDRGFSWEIRWAKGSTSTNDVWLAAKTNCEIFEKENKKMNEENIQRICSDCGRVIEENEEYYITGDIRNICEECYEESYYTCDECGAIYPVDEGIVVNIGEMLICEDCAETESYYRCEGCGKYFTENFRTRYQLANGDDVCSHCADDVEECHECGELFWRDDMTSDEIGWETVWYCADCDRGRRKCIHDYGYKPTPKYKVHNHDEFWADDSIKELLFGVELEIDKGEDAEQVAAEITDSCEDVYCKHDGSLSCGVEIVTHPCTLEYHLNDLGWDEICRIALDNGFTSHEARTCGLHIHVGRKQLGESEDERKDNIAKIIMLVDRHWDSIVNFTRRTSSQLGHWAAKPDISSIISRARDEYLTYDINSEISSEGRYQAVNLQNRNTIEFRIYNGTLKVGTLYATLQFTSNVCKYAMTHSIDECLASQWKDVAEYETTPELMEYLEARKLNDVADIEPQIRRKETQEEERLPNGSRVRILNSKGISVDALGRHIGEIATIIAPRDGCYDYCLQFDTEDTKFHDGGGRGLSHHCYWVYEENIELVNE